jgi:DOPA 4,5-dioxygenase
MTIAVNEYHIHVYFEDASQSQALALRDALASQHPVRLEHTRTQASGPHPKPDWLAAIDADQFGTVIPWLMLNRGTLDILVHPVIGDLRSAHDDYAIWMGQILPLMFERLAPR